MKRLLAVLLLSGTAFAGTSAVTATITDSDSQTWNNGKYTATLNSPNGPPTISGVKVTATFFSGSLSSSGVLTQTMTDTSTLDQTGATWCFVITPNASAPAGGTCLAVTGATPNLSTALSASVKAPRFAPGVSSYGYLDAEVLNPILGSSYYNVTTPCYRQFSQTGWGCGPTGGVQTINGTTPIVASTAGSTTTVSCPTCSTATGSSGTANPQGLSCSAGQTYSQNVSGVTQLWLCSPNGAVWVNQTTQAVVYAGAATIMGFAHCYEMTDGSGSSTISDSCGSVALNVNGGGSGGAPTYHANGGYTFNNTIRQYIGIPTAQIAVGSTYMICFQASQLGGGNGAGEQLLGDTNNGQPSFGVDAYSSFGSPPYGSSLAINSSGGTGYGTAGIDIIPLNIPACYTWVWDGSGNDKLYMGTSLMPQKVNTSTAQSIPGDPMGLGGAVFGLPGTIYKYGMATSELATDIIQHNALVWSSSIAAAQSTTVQTVPTAYQSNSTLINFWGDSRTAGPNGQFQESYAEYVIPGMKVPNFYTYLIAVGSQTISGYLSQGIFAQTAAIASQNHQPGTPYAECTNSFAMGINDISAGDSAATVYSNWQQAVSLFAKNDCPVLAITINPAQGSTGPQNTTRLTVNADIIAGGYWRGMVDIANDLRFMNPAIAYNLFYDMTPYSVDGLHESVDGAKALAGRVLTEINRIGNIGAGTTFEVSCPTAYCDIDMRNGPNQQIILTNNITDLKIINGNQGSNLNLTVTQALSGGPYTVGTPTIGAGATATVTSGGTITLVSGGAHYDQNFQPVLYVTGLTCSVYPRYSSTVTNGAIASIAVTTGASAPSGCSGTGTVTATSTEPVWSNWNAAGIVALTAGQSLAQHFTFDGFGQSIN